MRKIFLDTETTGLDPKQGHRIIEIGCVEMLGRRLTDRKFHYYLNPEREIDAGALEVHGINLDFLQDKPLFGDIAAEFLDFVRDAELVIHNAPFDVAFLNAELLRLDLAPIETICDGVCDTLRMAKELFPGKSNKLDALCTRYGVDNARRTLHGALLDAELLSEVYIAMTRGQASLDMELAGPAPSGKNRAARSANKKPPRVLHASPDENEEHRRLLTEIREENKGKCLWLEIEKDG
ncbi:MAG: DNA polymerase III subunit epsilon [Candidatus Accumulibacter sp.]|jgi:DNA polymerase-3 subunit epsilon|nr:DNA polymerase III subunit epsilon [Accumulibacter sp.]